MASNIAPVLLNYTEAAIALANGTASHQVTSNDTIPVFYMVTNESLQPTTTDHLFSDAGNITSNNELEYLLKDTNSTLGYLPTNASRAMALRPTKLLGDIGAGVGIPTTTMKSFHPGSHIFVAKANGDADIQALVYVFAVVLFYGLILVIALLGIRARRRHDTRLEDDYAALIDRTEVMRKDTALRQKMDALRLSNVQHGYMLDQIPEHEFWCPMSALTIQP